MATLDDPPHTPPGKDPAKAASSQGFDFSFSGLKSAVARQVEHDPRLSVPDVAASFQEAVAANARLREVAAGRCAAAGLTLRVPPPALCTDNGLMIAAVGDLLVQAGHPPATLDLSANPSCPLTKAVCA